MVTVLSVEEAAEFFTNIYGQAWPGQIILEVMDIKRDEKGKVSSRIKQSFAFSTIQMFLDSMDPFSVQTLQDLGYHFFFTVCPTDLSEKRKKANVAGIHVLWADVDHVDEAEMKARLEACDIPPTGVVKSGGGYHLYWKLDRIYEPGPDIDEALKRVRGWVGGDNTQDITRLLRVPGTWNYGGHKGYPEPVKCEIKSWIRSAVYKLEEFLNAPLTFGEIRLKEEFKTKYILKGECFSEENPDRSERDFAVIKELLRANHTDEEVVDIFTNPAYGCSSKVLEKDGNGIKYLQLTLAKARQEVGSLETSVYDDGLVIIKKKVTANGLTHTETISNFCVEVLSHVNVTSTDTPFTEIRIRCKGRVKEVALLPQDFLSFSSFIQNSDFAGLAFIGTESDWKQYQFYLFAKDAPLINATDIVGWVKDSFVLKDKTIVGPHVRYIATGLTPPKVVITKEEIDIDNFFKTIEHHLWGLRPQVAFPLFGWMLASIQAPRIREMFPPGYFPLICADGPPGSGKTTMATLFPEVLYGLDNAHSFADSPASIRRSLAGSNALPIVLDEYEDSRRFKNVDEMNQYIRLAFQGGAAQRFNFRGGGFGRADEMKMLSPLCLTASYGLKDEAIIDRTYIVRVPALSTRRDDPERCRGEKALLAVRGALPRGAFLPVWTATAPTWIARIAGLLGASEGSARKQLGFAIIASVLLELAEKYNWRLTLEDLLDFYNDNQKHITLESPQQSVDQILGRAIYIRKLIMQKEWYLETGPGLPPSQFLFVRSGALIEEMIATLAEMQLGYHIDRKWVQQNIRIFKEEGKILDTERQSCKINGKNARYVVLDLEHFPVTAEAVSSCLM